MAISNQSIFHSEDVMVLFTTSLAGLGHVRVTEALKRGLSEDVRTETIGISDKNIQILHRLTSRNRFFAKVADFFQNTPLAEEVFTTAYRGMLQRNTKDIIANISDLVSRRRPIPKTLVIISTHFGLAHKIASIKEKLSKELNMCVTLCVVVTDDSPQKIWGVYGADCIFVPSQFTKNQLTSYMVKLSVPLPSIIVSPYPVSPIFSKLLSSEEIQNRRSQVKKYKGETTQIIIPISGAAVQLTYIKKIISYLNKKGNVEISVVSRDSSYTSDFLKWCQDIPSVEVLAEKLDREIVISYEKEMERKIYSLEITKPSEQLFKTLLTPDQQGGLIILFSDPVGRQEYDNLSFLKRHGLIPNDNDQNIIFNLFNKTKRESVDQEFLQRARQWRGLLLPKNDDHAGRVIYWLKKTGILSNMMNFQEFTQSEEVSGNGVDIFWKKLEERVKNKCYL